MLPLHAIMVWLRSCVYEVLGCALFVQSCVFRVLSCVLSLL